MKLSWLKKRAEMTVKADYIDRRMGELYTSLGLDRRQKDPLWTEDAELTITVIGEFNSGKSTLLNAMLRQDILPMGIIPTTATINILRHSDQPSIVVEYKDGRTDSLEYARESLSDFKATKGTFDEVRCINVCTPDAPVGYRIIDTPGVNDVCQTRMDIVYGFIPQSDAVVFVMDAQQALKKSEVDFLTGRLLGSSLTKMAYVLNHADRLSAEEASELTSDIRARLTCIYARAADDAKVAGGIALATQIAEAAENLHVFTLSAKAVLRGSATTYPAFGDFEWWLSDLSDTNQASKMRFRRRLALQDLSAQELGAHLDTLMQCESAGRSDFEAAVKQMAETLDADATELATLADQLDSQLRSLKVESRERLRAALEPIKLDLQTELSGTEASAASAEAGVRKALDLEVASVNDSLTKISGRLGRSLSLQSRAECNLSLCSRTEESGNASDPLHTILFSLAGLALFGPLGLLAGPVLAFLGLYSEADNSRQQIDKQFADLHIRLADELAVAIDAAVDQIRSVAAASLEEELVKLHALLGSRMGTKKDVDPSKLRKALDEVCTAIWVLAAESSG